MSSAALAYPQKSAEAFRTISEVATDLDIPQHVLRFWESRFAQIRPVKRAGGRRFYRPEDVDLLKGIRSLLYTDGFTIKGVQKVLKDKGLRHVAEIGRGGAPIVAAVPAAPKVIEKIVYIEKPAKKPRPTHLRAVPDMSLPFFDFDAPARPEPVPAMIATIAAAVAEQASENFGERERLGEILDELEGLKDRLQAARERLA